jgi:hypothetical protein
MSNTNYSYSGSDLGSQFGLPNPALNDWLKLKEFKYSPSQNTLYPTTAEGQPVVPAGNPVSPETKSKEAFDFETWQKMQQVAAKTSADLTRQQIADLFPYLSAASSEATARNLAASTQFLLTKEQSPTAQALRNQVAQGQISTAAGAEAERDRATAAQALAAKEFARGYAGTTFRMA